MLSICGNDCALNYEKLGEIQKEFQILNHS